MSKEQTPHPGTLLEFTRLINTSLDLEEMLKHLLRSVLGYLLVSKGLIAIQREDGEYSISLVRGLKEVKAGDRFDKDLVAKFGICKIYPIGKETNPIGYLGVSSRLRGEMTFDQEEMISALLGVAAGNITNAITHKQVQILNQELRQKNQELRAILEFSQELSLSIEPENILGLLALTLCGQWAVKRYSVITWRDPYQPILRQKGINIKNINILKQYLVGLPKVIFVLDLPTSELKATLLEQGGNIIFPIVSHNAKTEGSYATELLGVIILGQRAKKSYTNLELEFGISLVAQASVALQQAWHVKEIVDKKQSAAKQLGQKQADKVFSALVDVLPGTVLDDKYKLENKIGSGGFGAIYQATHLGLNSPVAVKILRPMAGNKNLEQLARFHQEAITACKLNHPNAVKILDCSISKQGIAYLVMELLSGCSLSDFLKTHGVLSIEYCARIIYPVCNVLSHAHSMSMVHRDIKPENIFLHQSLEGEIIKIVDFGLAKIYSDNSLEETRNLTQYGEILGTPAYISPERVRGERCDGQTDVYSLGIVIYEILTGKLPFHFRENTFFSMAMSHITDAPTPLRQFNPNIDEDVENIVMQTLNKEPFERPTAKDLAKFFLQIIAKSTNHIFESNNILMTPDNHLLTKEIRKETSSIYQKDTQLYDTEKSTENIPEQVKTVKAVFQEDWSNKTKIDDNILSVLKNVKSKSSTE
ncbi:MAG: serine/threonine protein kinase [Acidobacteria bacterium]|nr:serine/threonine protein kinase [Acidobacteriota bacterium]